MEELFMYFTFVYDWVNVLQLIAVSFSVVLVLSSVKPDGQGLIRFCVEVVCVFAGETLFNWLLFYLSHYLKWLAGINFPLAHLIVITIYAAAVCKYNVKSRIVLGGTVFVTAIAMAELGAQSMRFFASGGSVSHLLAVATDILIVVFAELIHLRSIHVYEDIPKISVGAILVVALPPRALSALWKCTRSATSSSPTASSASCCSTSIWSPSPSIWSPITTAPSTTPSSCSRSIKS